MLNIIDSLPLFQSPGNSSEDCLNINVIRPTGATASSQLPVLFWIYGGGYLVSLVLGVSGWPLTSA